MKTDRERLRVVFDSMKSRCYNVNKKSYKYYGGKGVYICDEWLKGFKYFYDWAINNGYEYGLTIERVNVDGPYSPGNCIWIERKLQSKNQTSNNKVEIDGVIKNVSDWARDTNIHRTTINSRISRGITGKDLLKPIEKEKKKTVVYLYKGQSMTLKEIADLNSITKQAIRKHLNRGLNIEQAVEGVKVNKYEKK